MPPEKAVDLHTTVGFAEIVLRIQSTPILRDPGMAAIFTTILKAASTA
jgi:hypothetical protein